MEEFWERSPYLKWYKSHRRFSFTAKLFIESYEEKKKIPQALFKPFIKSLFCHSKSEEKIFNFPELQTIFLEHADINPSKLYTEEEKYNLCKSLLIHMKEEEEAVKKYMT